jgi:hypothetical protein
MRRVVPAKRVDSVGTCDYMGNVIACRAGLKFGGNYTIINIANVYI